MNRQDAIQKIVWSLLAHAGKPAEAVAAATAVKSDLGPRAEGDFRNLLRAAGAFARDDDGFFVRYALDGGLRWVDDHLLAVPPGNHFLTMAVPIEARMRIAYSVLMGLLTKYLYQEHGVVPIQVAEGIAELRVPVRSQLPNAEQVWREFQASDLAKDALRDGINATLSAVGNIGAVAVTAALAATPLLPVLLQVLPKYEWKFQAQGGMRLDFFLMRQVKDWRHDLGVTGQQVQTVDRIWETALSGYDCEGAGKLMAISLVDEALKDTSKPMSFRSIGAIWSGEGSGSGRKKGRKDELGWKPRTEWKDIGNAQRVDNARRVDDTIKHALGLLDRRRQGTKELHQWVAEKLKASRDYTHLLSSLVDRLSNSGAAGEAVRARGWASPTKVSQVDATLALQGIISAWSSDMLIPTINPREIPAALRMTFRNLLAWQLSQRVDLDDIAVFGWPTTVLRQVPAEQVFSLRFVKEPQLPWAKMILKVVLSGVEGSSRKTTVSLLGAVTRLADKTSLAPPFALYPSDQPGKRIALSTSLPSMGRCIVCGASGDLIAGAKSFLPESKKRWYESPTSFVEPKLCSNCAFVAYLSAIYPNDDTSIAEFPADNFLELFALHKNLQGASGVEALKVMNRVATMSVLPNRYLILSKSVKQGRMDSKTQIYSQLRNQVPLLERLDRPMRVQVEGAQPNFWSEIHPHVAVGLSHFVHFPAYHEREDRKVLAQQITRALLDGRPFGGLYLATRAQQPQHGFGRERDVLTRGISGFEAEFVREKTCGTKLARALGGERMHGDFYEDVIELSNYLLDLARPLVQREVHKSRTAVSGVARKYTELITRDFAESRAGKFLYVVVQEADAAEREGDSWAKWQLLENLYGGRPLTAGKEGEEAARLWSEFRHQHPKTVLETKIECLRGKCGNDVGLWSKFLAEVQARTLALLMLNVRNISTR